MACREERSPRAEHDRNEDDDELIDEAESQRLAADLPGSDIDEPTAISRAAAIPSSTLVTNVNGAESACSQAPGRSWVTT